MWCAWSQTHEQTFWICLHWMKGHCQTSQWQVTLQLWRVLGDGWWSSNDVQMPLWRHMGTCWSNLQWLIFFSIMVLKEVHTYLDLRSQRDLVGMQCLHRKVTALNTHQASLDTVCHICFHPQPVDICSSQGQCLVDSCMAFVEIILDNICRMVRWQLVHLSWVDHPQLRGHHGNPSNFWWFWGCLCICWANHSVLICVLLTGLDLIVFLLQSLSGGSLWRPRWIWHRLWGEAGSVC